ncbi:MAG: ArnT family glycosyltransferase [Chitinophagaceae bacterium]
MKQSNSTIDFLFIISASLVCYFSFLGHIHLFDWDEINFAECAREMIVTGDYWHVQIDFKPFHEKPPLFIWMQALSMQLFGINEYAARFPNAVCGLVTLLSLYFIGRKHVSRGFALAWVLTYIGSLLPHFYFKSGIIDPWFNYFIFISLYFIYRFFKSAEFKHLLIAGLFSGLAVFTKGPVAFLLLSITIFIFLFIETVQKKKPMRWLFWLKSGLLFTLLSFLFLGLWYGLDIIYNGPTLFYDFIAYQIRLMNTEDAGHGGFPGYHVVVLLIGCFPASFYFLYYLLKRKSLKQNQPLFLHWLLILFWVVLIVFSIVQSKIVHYSSLAYFPITAFSAYLIYTWLNKKNTIPKAIQYPVLFFHLVLGILLSLVPFIPQSFIQSFLDKDPFAKANFDVLLHWNPLSYGIAIFYTLCVLGLFLYVKRYPRTRLIYTGQFLFSLLFLHLFFWFYLGNIEKITQGTAINFFQSLKGKAVYTGVYGYKSYAPFFYAEVQPDSVFTNQSREEVLVHSSLKKPVYLVSKINIEQSLLGNGFTELVRLNGFVFFIKDSTTIR